MEIIQRILDASFYQQFLMAGFLLFILVLIVSLVMDIRDQKKD